MAIRARDLGLAGESIGHNVVPEHLPHDMDCPAIGSRSSPNYWRAACVGLRQPRGCRCAAGDEAAEALSGRKVCLGD